MAGLVTLLGSSAILAQRRPAVEIRSDTGELESFTSPLDEFGRAVASLGDLDGDGGQEILVGAPRSNDGGSERGALYLISLTEDFEVLEIVPLHSDTTISSGLEDGAQFGSSLCSLGDLGGDGTLEVAVGAPGTDLRSGAVWILSVTSDKRIGSPPLVLDRTIGNLSLVDNARFGLSVARLDDIDKNQLPELVIGAPLTEHGQLWVLPLKLEGGLPAVDLQRIRSSELDFADRVMTGTRQRFGFAIAQTADFDLDEVGDLAVGVPGDIYRGISGGTVVTAGLDLEMGLGPQRTLHGAHTSGDQFGFALLDPGDPDLIGVRELFVGSPFSSTVSRNGGNVFRLLIGQGGQVLAVDALSETIGQEIESQSLFGSALGLLPDLDRDGISDLLVGAPDGLDRRGSVWIVFRRGIATPTIRSMTVDPGPIPLDTEEISVSAVIEDEAGIRRAWLDLRRGGEESWLSIQMLAKPGPTYVQTIPSTFIDERGVEFVIRARNESGLESRSPPTGYYSLPLTVTEGPSIDVRRGMTSSAYQLISVPLDLTNPSARDQLTDDLGLPDTRAWRFLQQSANRLTDLSDQDFKLTTGRAYWMLAGDVIRTISFGSGGTTPTDEVFRIALRPGWNLVGNPFAFAVPRHALALDSHPVDLRSFEDGEWKTDISSLEPYKGYAVWNNLGRVDSLKIDPSIRGVAPIGLPAAIDSDPGAERERLLKSLVPATDVNRDELGQQNARWTIEGIFPNPSSGDVSVVYTVSHPSKGTVSVFDLTGRHVATLVDQGQHRAGRFVVRWRSCCEDGVGCVSGLYFVRTATAGQHGVGRPLTIVR